MESILFFCQSKKNVHFSKFSDLHVQQRGVGGREACKLRSNNKAQAPHPSREMRKVEDVSPADPPEILIAIWLACRVQGFSCQRGLARARVSLFAHNRSPRTYMYLENLKQEENIYDALIVIGKFGASGPLQIM